MKSYKCKTGFTSPTLGEVKAGDRVTIAETVGDKMADAGLLEQIETKPQPAADKKETKPRKITKKATK